MSLNWNVVANLTGQAGFSALSGIGAPSSSLGKIGDIYVDTKNALLYPAKTSAGWAAASAATTLVGPVTQQVLPSDLTGNSLTLSPVSGDTKATTFALTNNSNTVFSVNNVGNLLANAASVASFLSSGTAQAQTLITSPGSLSAPAFTFNSQIDTGIYLPTPSTSAAVMALVVNATTALSLTATGVSLPGTLTVSGATTLGVVSTGALTAASLVNTGSGTAKGFFSSIAGSASAPAYAYTAQTDSGLYLATASASAAVLALAVNGSQALALAKGGVSVPGTLAVTGASTLAALSAQAATVASLTASGTGSFGGTVTLPAVNLSGTGATITFADGTTQTTAAKSYTPGTSAVFLAGNGAVSAPSFSYSNQTDTGAYLATQSATGAALAFAVNGTQALSLTNAGVSVPGILSVTGTTTLAALSASNITGSGTLTLSGAANLGPTTLSSLNVTGNAQVQGSTTLGAASVASMNNSGTSTAAAFTISSSSGKLTFGDGSFQTTAASTPNVGSSPTFTATSAGSVTAPSFLFSAQTDSGLYLATPSTTAAVLAFTVNKTQSIALSAAGVTVPGALSVSGAVNFSGASTFGAVNMSSLTLSGNLTVNGSSALQALTVTSLTNTGTTTSGGHTVSANGSASVPSYSFTSQTDTGMYLPTASNSAAVLGFSANGTLALNVLKGGITVPGTLGVSGQSTLAATSATTLAVSGNATIGGTELVSGLLTASGNITTPLVKTSQGVTSTTIGSVSYLVSNVQFPGTFGDGTSYPLSGISSDTLGNLIFNYQGSPAFRMSNPGYNSGSGTGPTTAYPLSFLAGSYTFSGGGNTLFTLSSSTAKYGFTSNTVPFTMQSLSGNILVLQNGGTAPNYTTTTVGAFDYSGNMSLSGNASVVNASLSGTLNVSGVTTLAVTNTAAITASALIQAPAFTISTSGGKLTFGDGTTQTTAYNPSGAATSAGFSSTSNGSVTAPAFTFTNQSDTGIYLANQSTSAAVLALTVNGTQTISTSKTATTVTGAANVSGNISGAIHYANATGSQSAPVFASGSNTNTGMYFSSTPAVVLTANGTGALNCSATAVNALLPLNVTGAAVASGTVTGTSIITSATGSASAPVFTSSISNSTGMYVSSTPSVVLTASGTGVFSANTTAVTSVPTVKAPAFTINASGGAVTFGDNTTQTTAAVVTPVVQSFGPYQIIATSQGAGIWNFFAPGNASGNTLWTVNMPYAGYVLGFSVVGTFSVANSPGFYISKQVVSGGTTTGSDIITIPTNTVTSATILYGYNYYAGSAIAFNAGDLLTMKLNLATTSSYNLTGFINVQFTSASVKSLANIH